MFYRKECAGIMVDVPLGRFAYDNRFDVELPEGEYLMHEPNINIYCIHKYNFFILDEFELS